ncbi:MAG: hypothetical protein WC781_05500 [Candidatus Pacearchaeota archaeon]|jgi:hypothetical protein
MPKLPEVFRVRTRLKKVLRKDILVRIDELKKAVYSESYIAHMPKKNKIKTKFQLKEEIGFEIANDLYMQLMSDTEKFDKDLIAFINAWLFKLEKVIVKNIDDYKKHRSIVVEILKQWYFNQKYGHAICQARWSEYNHGKRKQMYKDLGKIVQKYQKDNKLFAFFVLEKIEPQFNPSDILGNHQKMKDISNHYKDLSLKELLTLYVDYLKDTFCIDEIDKYYYELNNETEKFYLNILFVNLILDLENKNIDDKAINSHLNRIGISYETNRELYFALFNKLKPQSIVNQVENMNFDDFKKDIGY